MPEDRVDDDEKLYRRVPNHPGNIVPLENGEYRVSSAAFGDRQMKPSVDRAKLRNNDPRNSQDSPTDYVAGLVAHDVRNKIDVPRNINGKQERCHVDVIPDPIKDHPDLPDNPAHALICAVPDLSPDEKAVFRKLKTALAGLAKWEIPPQ